MKATPHEQAMEQLAQDLTGDLARLNRWQSANPTAVTDERDPKPRGKR